MNKKVYVVGIILGLVMPYLGLFFGLQVSTTLGNLLAYPLVALAYLLDTPIGMWSPIYWVLGLGASVLIWTEISKFLYRKFMQSKGE